MQIGALPIKNIEKWNRSSARGAEANLSTFCCQRPTELSSHLLPDPTVCQSISCTAAVPYDDAALCVISPDVNYHEQRNAHEHLDWHAGKARHRRVAVVVGCTFPILRVTVEQRSSALAFFGAQGGRSSVADAPSSESVCT